MGEFQQYYKIRLRPITPVFIGSGKNYSKNEYVLLKNARKILIPDLHKLFKKIIQNNLIKQYEEFNVDSENTDLGSWLEDNNIEVSEQAEWVRYSLALTQEEYDDFSRMEIQSFMKDAYGNPYIPGSSLKGAIRTALLGAELQKGNTFVPAKLATSFQNVVDSEYRDCRQYVKELNNKNKNMEQKVFNKLQRQDKHYSATNDYMGAIRISDSKPLSVDNLILCRKVDQFTDGKVNLINTLRESIFTAKFIEFDMVIDTGLLKNAKYVNKRLIENSVQSFYKNINDNFVQYFEGYHQQYKNVIYLGGGTGFLTKTMLYPLLGQEKGRNVTSKILHSKFDKRHKHNILDDKVSPHILKCTYHKSKIPVQMGMCQIEVIPY